MSGEPLPNRIAQWTARSAQSLRLRRPAIPSGPLDAALSPAQRALAWVRAHELPTGGIRVHSNHSAAYQEVSGYLIPTLLQYDEPELAVRLAEWLIGVQRPDGAFSDPDRNDPYIFDTGQALRGLLAIEPLLPRARPAALSAAKYLCSETGSNGKEGFGNRYSGAISESVHLYVLPPVARAAALFDDSEMANCVHNCLEHYQTRDDFLRLDDLTHFLAYQLEALIDLGSPDAARPALDALLQLQREDGSVRGMGKVAWVCTPGLAQIAICWYKLGQATEADAAIDWLSAHQNPSGGFFGSRGRGASYLAKSEISWAAKFFLDAWRLRAARRQDAAQ